MRDFTKGSVAGHVLAFSVPLIIGNFFMSFYNIMNMVWIGRLLGHEAVAAVAAGMPLLMLFPSLLIGLTISTNILVAQARGRDDHAMLRRVLSSSLLTLLALCVVLSVSGFLLRHELIHWVRAPVEVRGLAADYLGLMLGGMIFNFFFNWVAAALRGFGDARTTMYGLILMTALNAGLVPLFIAGAGPLPAMGLHGAAWGTLLAGFLSSVAIYFYVARRYPDLDMRRWSPMPEGKLVKRIFAIGVPASLQMIVVSFSGVMLIRFVNHYGTNATAAMGIGMQIDQLAMIPAMSIGIAATSIAAQNIGRGHLERLPAIARHSLGFAVTLATLFTLATFFFPRAFGGFFLKPGLEATAVLSIAENYFRFIAWTYLFYAVMFTFQGVVRGAGDTIPLLLISAVALLLFRLPLVWYLSEKTSWGLDGIWIAVLASLACAALLSGAYYKWGPWRRRRALHGSAQAAPGSGEGSGDAEGAGGN